MKPGKKGFALLLDAGPKKRPNDASKVPPDEGDDLSDHTEPDGEGNGDEEDLSDLDDLMGGDEEPDGDEMGGGLGDQDGDEGDPTKIDPEAAALATKLGIHEPVKQQALIDLIQLVTGPEYGGGASASPPAPGASLPESSY